MKIFLDSANIDEIKEALSTGFIDGITTNPSLLAKNRTDVREILRLTHKPISLEVTTSTIDEMIDEGIALGRLGENVVVKLPATLSGLKATRVLIDRCIMVNTTLVFSVNQALLAAKAGADYVSIFVGRLDDLGSVGMDVVRDTLQVYNKYDFHTNVITASVRHPEHVIEAAKVGSHVATMPYTVFQQMYQHSLTDKGLKQFLDDYKTWKK